MYLFATSMGTKEAKSIPCFTNAGKASANNSLDEGEEFNLVINTALSTSYCPNM